MGLSNEQLICEAVECNHAGVGRLTVERYRDHLVHFAQYLASVHKSDFYKANKKHVRLFMGHLEKQGGDNPDSARLRCDWCKARGYPDGREGPGWSASYRKSYLSALRFLYHHFQADDELPDIDPTVLESSPRVIVSPGFGHELHPAFGARRGDGVEAPEVRLDLVDRGEDGGAFGPEAVARCCSDVERSEATWHGRAEAADQLLDSAALLGDRVPEGHLDRHAAPIRPSIPAPASWRAARPNGSARPGPAPGPSPARLDLPAVHDSSECTLAGDREQDHLPRGASQDGHLEHPTVAGAEPGRPA